jgi:hypothetical protein
MTIAITAIWIWIAIFAGRRFLPAARSGTRGVRGTKSRLKLDDVHPGLTFLRTRRHLAVRMHTLYELLTV